MTVGKLIEMLKEYEEDMEIVIQPSNSTYAEIPVRIIEHKGVRSFYGNDYKALVLKSANQVGAVCDEDELHIKYKIQLIAKAFCEIEVKASSKEEAEAYVYGKDFSIKECEWNVDEADVLEVDTIE